MWNTLIVIFKQHSSNLFINFVDEQQCNDAFEHIIDAIARGEEAWSNSQSYIFLEEVACISKRK